MIDRYMAVSKDGGKRTCVCSTIEDAKREAVALALQRNASDLTEGMVPGLWRSLSDAGWRIKGPLLSGER